jgi:hypothetical protein
MSLQAVLSRINELSPVPLPPVSATPTSETTASPFSNYLQEANSNLPSSSGIAPDPSSLLGQLQMFSPGALNSNPLIPQSGPSSNRLVAFAQAEVGKGEINPGTNSNESGDIERYKSATQGALPNAPWCAYFVSYISREAGVPLGDNGQGIGSVSEIRSWAARTGRLHAGNETPAPGDLMLFGDKHVGMVESVDSNGTIHTIEGNSGDMVSRREYAPGSATDFVRP